jgi:hypothetical protein
VPLAATLSQYMCKANLSQSQYMCTMCACGHVIALNPKPSTLEETCEPELYLLLNVLSKNIFPPLQAGAVKALQRCANLSILNSLAT